MKIRIPIEILELEPENFHILLKSDFENEITGNWVIDTGASKSVFDKNLGELYVLNENESEEIYSAGITEEPLKSLIGHLKPFSFKNYKVEHFKIALLDLSHINKLYSKTTDIEICGLLGGDFLMKHKAIIDYKKKQLVLKKL